MDRLCYHTTTLSPADALAALERASGLRADQLPLSEADAIVEHSTPPESERFEDTGLALESYMMESARFPFEHFPGLRAAFIGFIQSRACGVTGLSLRFPLAPDLEEPAIAYFTVISGRFEVSLDLPFAATRWAQHLSRYRAFFAHFDGSIDLLETTAGCTVSAPPSAELRCRMVREKAPDGTASTYPVSLRVAIPPISPDIFWEKILHVPRLLKIETPLDLALHAGAGWTDRDLPPAEVLANYRTSLALLSTIPQWEIFTCYFSAKTLAALALVNEWQPQEELFARLSPFPWKNSGFDFPLHVRCQQREWWLLVENAPAEAMVGVSTLTGLPFRKRPDAEMLEE